MSIRLKVALPYILLTVVVAVIGVYVVTRLVTGSMNERLTNQLLEAGRAVSDGFVRQEKLHVDEARQIAYTEGVAQALKNGDRSVSRLVTPVFQTSGIENLILISRDGIEIVHFLIDNSENVIPITQDTRASESPIVAALLQSQDPDASPKRALGANLVDGKAYYYTAMPISVNGEFEGVIVVGTSIKTLLPNIANLALADIVIYGVNGQVLSTTLSSADIDTLQLLSITQQDYQTIIRSENLVTGDNFLLDKRNYILGRAPLQVGNDRIGVFAVILPSDFVIQFGKDNRYTYALIFAGVMVVVIAIGTLVARTIIKPLYLLVHTSQAIASGDLNQRTGIKTKDEIGTLASTFDEMTTRLQERTKELEHTNQMLQQIDKTKTNFIQISAHELRTPLTLIMGYSQMLEQDTINNPELSSLAHGILEGAERMTDIVESMLDVSRIDSDSLVLKKTSLPIEKIIQKVRKEFSKALDDRRINFDFTGLDVLPAVYADPDLIYKVFYHLVMNAIKYTPDGGEVRVTGKYLNGSEPPHVELAVCDTGIGIDPGMKEVIFEKFHQTGEVLLHSSGKTKFKGGGPGLGLAIARGIVQAHGGHIWVESPGYNEKTRPGSKFFVSLPVQKELEKVS